MLRSAVGTSGDEDLARLGLSGLPNSGSNPDNMVELEECHVTDVAK